MELPELILGSRTQSQETIEQITKDLGYDGLSVETQSDKVKEPAEDTPVPGETAAAAEPPVDGDPPVAGTEDEPASEETLGADVTDPNNPKRSGSARLKRKLGEREQEIADLKEKLAAIEARTAPKPEAEITIPEAAAQPNAEDFENGIYDKGYVLALSKWQHDEAKREDLVKAEADRKVRVDAQAKSATEAEQKAAQERWLEQVEIGKSRHEDFDEVMQRAGSLSAVAPLAEALKDSDLSGLVIYYLVTHPQELDRLNQSLNVPEDAPPSEFRRKMRAAYQELSKLETLVSQDTGEPAPKTDADPSQAKPAGEAPAVPAAAPAAPAAAPKPKPEPVRPVGSRGPSPRKRLQDMNREEIHSMQVTDPDGFRRLVEASR